MRLRNTVWFRCIACLLIIAVISGAMLAVLNDLLFVSPEMRTARAIEKIYGEERDYTVILDVDSGDAAIEYDGVGTINKIYEVGGDRLFCATGFKGYKNGTVVLWIKVVSDGETYAIDNVLLETSEKQTLMSKLTGEFYGNFRLTDLAEANDSGNFFSATDETAENFNPVSGATYSATAAANAVNCVIKYIGGKS